MKNIQLLFVSSSLFLLSACTGSEVIDTPTDENIVLTEEEMKNSIFEMDDSLAVLINEVVQSNAPMPKLAYHEAINRSKAFFANYPNSEYAPIAVEKIQSMYEALRVPELATQWRDTLLTKYPNYEGNVMAIQFQAMYYDMEMNDLEKAEYYYKMALSKKDLDSLTRIQILSRIENIDLTYDELIDKMMNEAVATE